MAVEGFLGTALLRKEGLPLETDASHRDVSNTRATGMQVVGMVRSASGMFKQNPSL